MLGGRADNGGGARPSPGTLCQVVLVALVVAYATTSAAQPKNSAAGVDDETTTPDEAESDRPTEAAAAQSPEVGETIVVDGKAPLLPSPVAGRASSEVSREEIRRRQPRSIPDALRYQAGVYVQQTSAGQGSAFVRGRTGQQTMLMFDGIRLNNSLFRQGPNQYFFTIDTRTVERIEVMRGGASTEYGSDAIAGSLNAMAVEPDPGDKNLRAKASLRGTTADGEAGGRMQLDGRLAPGLTVVTGIGYRRVGLLEGGGVVVSPVSGEAPQVPRIDKDGRTQLGTGFKELAGDARLVWKHKDWRLSAAFYDYRQYDAKRTDQCPPAFAPLSECLTFDEQFHTLGYLRVDGDFGPVAESLWATVSVQRQRERFTRDRPMSAVQNGGRDDVTTFGVALKAKTRARELDDWGRLLLSYGGDLYHDRVGSAAWTILTDIGYVAVASRGQHLAGSRYSTGGIYAGPELDIWDRVTLRAGARAAYAAAMSPADPQSGTKGIDTSWATVVGFAGVEAKAASWLTVLANVDRSFRAPNLDDLTARQATGPGFQFENATLDPERAITAEVGARFANDRFAGEVWAYDSRLAGSISRAVREASDCPPDSSGCNTAWFRYQLVNLDGISSILGAEASLQARLAGGFSGRATIAYARGDGPNPQEPPTDPTQAYEKRVPLSRIAPLNGSVELSWQQDAWFAALATRWAGAQTRLAISDRSDERIPEGGTPGYVTTDLRAGYTHVSKTQQILRFNLVFENLFDAAYRYHGSSINGPGRGLLATMEIEL